MSDRSQIKRDYKTRAIKKESVDDTSTGTFWGLMMASVLFLSGAVYFTSFNPFAFKFSDIKTANTTATELTNQTNNQAKITLPLNLPNQITANLPEASAVLTNAKWQSVKVRNGDNLAKIFARMKLTPRLLHDIVSSDKKMAKQLKRLKPGQSIHFLLSNNKFVSLKLEINKLKHLRVNKTSSGFSFNTIERTPEIRITHATGKIESSLYLAAKDAKLSDNLIMGLANIFGWDIDFALDIRQGDRFIVAFEELYLDGEKYKDGNIVAAEFINKNKNYRAVQYTDPKNNTGYFTPEGRNMRKDFLRTPVDFTRISSRFGKRFHPVLNRMRAHKGVDYAAPRGTPIRATGDGKVIHKGRKGGYGKAIIIQHGSNKRTLYAHMSSYKRGIRKNRRVKQGQIIGFVGSTGLASGPHLHYEFRINGVHRNPLRIKFASANPIPKKLKDDFNYKTNGYSALLDLLGKTNIALTETPDNILNR